MPSPGEVPLSALVEAAQAELASAGVDGAILRVAGSAGGTELAWFPLDGTHPLELLLRFVAPDHWHALGVSCVGRAHPLDDRGRIAEPAGPRVTVTLLMDRRGEAAGLLAEGTSVAALPGRPEGMVADACRRAFGLATAPPPPSTAGLWAAYWLDRIVEVAGRGLGGRRLRSWGAVAALHPALADTAVPGRAVEDPDRLAAAAAAWTRAWTWPRLRAAPATLDLPWLDRSPALAAWMDDGMWARWLLSALPHADDLLAAAHDLLGERLAAAVDHVIGATGGR